MLISLNKRSADRVPFSEDFVCLLQLLGSVNAAYLIEVRSFFCRNVHSVFPIVCKNVGQVVFVLNVVRVDVTERIKQMGIVKNIYPGIDFPHFSLIVGRIFMLDDPNDMASFAPQDSSVTARVVKVGRKDCGNSTHVTMKLYQARGSSARGGAEHPPIAQGRRPENSSVNFLSASPRVRCQVAVPERQIPPTAPCGVSRPSRSRGKNRRPRSFVMSSRQPQGLRRVESSACRQPRTSLSPSPNSSCGFLSPQP